MWPVMPLYDVVVMLKTGVVRREVVDLVRAVGSRVIADGGVVCDIKSFGSMQLAYEIKKPDGWHQEVRSTRAVKIKPSVALQE